VNLVSRITYTLDCCDPKRLSEFWSEALGYSSAGPFGDFWPPVPPESSGEPWLVLQTVSEPKSGKNRMHLDMHAADLDAEVKRLESLGAQRLSDLVVLGDFSWFVMADPEGNEFCIVRPGD
jgi:predicted enzyme related to lactoylglutathione lyase